MEVSKFIIDENDVYVKDAEARSELTSQSESMSEIQSEIDSQSVSYSEMFSEVDEELTTKQNVLIKGLFTGNIDDLKNSNDLNGVYLFNSASASGAMPSSSGYYYMLVVGSLQIAYRYNANAVDSTIVAYRIYLNSAWSVWREATFTV